MRTILIALLFISQTTLFSQDYFLEKYKPFQEQIPSPEEFLGYGIGEHHTRHDLIVAYLEKLASLSDRAELTQYGKTYEGRKLVILQISSEENISSLPDLQKRHLKFTDPSAQIESDDLPVFVNLAYNVHGNEPSSSEAALLSAYTLVASQHPEIVKFRKNSVIFLDPTINPDGRDRHTQWANTYQGSPQVSDPQDAEHDEYWPGGRTNHYWFDLNRDWLLGIHPESRGKLTWYHQWYPNVVTDFHEMGTQSSYFFEPMKTNGSLNPIMPKENYEYLNETFGEYFATSLDSIGSFYFTKEVFDGTYPGYGSSYPDLQGGLGLLFEQASSRGHVQETAYGEISFPFTIRNQYTSSMATLRAAVENREYLRKYQSDFFKSAVRNGAAARIKGYRFGETHDKNRLKAFIDKLLLHKIKVYKAGNDEYVVPADQPQYRMVQTVFETYDTYRDSVYYDASAWSLANFYNIKYAPASRIVRGEEVVSLEGIAKVTPVSRSDYAYIIDWDDYNAPALLHFLQEKELTLASAFKPFTAGTASGQKAFNYGSLILPVSLQKKNAAEIYSLIKEGQEKFEVPVYAASTGYSQGGIDLGSPYVRPLEQPKAAMLIGEGVRAYEAGEVWHLLDTRVHMPITKIPMRNLGKVKLDKYTTLVMVSGSYSLNKAEEDKIRSWVRKGNTLITIGTASEYLIKNKWVKEELISKEQDSLNAVSRMPYVDAPENSGKESVGGIIVEASLDLTHPLGFGYRNSNIPVYKNNTVWFRPSKNAYSTVAKYTEEPHIDGFITTENTEKFLKPAASLLVSILGEGRVVLFADNPNFRGSWFGTNRLFFNALFLGEHIRVPK